ncbi:STAS domain-containing protein [Amycolatopsis palatopharyngis]|uniref:STAS domain-containing protein n=1 Tax=Amycolatopsis palatopharyngis TaxID=187982 RepID=UPI000E2318EA|nr:STAS domain-containing protein [Amycolatopsis palatopharyngis]
MTTSSSPSARSAVSEDLLTVRTQQRDGVVVIHLDGDVDLVTVPVVATALNEALSAEPNVVLVDMSAVGFLCSKGVSLLIEVDEQARGAGKRLCLATTQRAVLRPLQLLGLQERFQILPSVSHALAELAGD